ncbi:endonuclease [Aureivirga sp. CE67]|uniref:endonuclease n=1 Tax=Aureivirga sp. CE67 TaxID=1788983 RepID=UPI0018C964CA|nr:endonuclease [Aureivirga sp. CE67]
MKKILLLSFLGVNALFAQAPDGYYDSATATGFTLKTQLKTIITNGHSAQGYGDLYSAYAEGDADNYYENDGSVLDMYSENPNGEDPYNFAHYTDKCGNYQNEGDCYNREHLFPQGIFGSASPMKSDFHHVVPSDGKVNGIRGSYPFGEVDNPSVTTDNGSKRGANSTLGYSGTVFEPIDEFKGDIARCMLYFATRYESQIPNWNHAMLDGSSDQVYEDWFIEILLNWHNQDPVNQREIVRNNAGYEFQGNRNPFIDHPEYVNMIWGDGVGFEAPSNVTISNITHTTADVTWDYTNDEVTIANYQVYVDGTLILNTTETNVDLINLTEGTDYTVYITATDTEDNVSAPSQLKTFTTTTDAITLIDEDFSNCDNIAFTAYDEASDKSWFCTDNNQYQMNGYQEDVLSKDWLITSEKINFDTYSDEKLSLFIKYKYGNSPLELVYSSDYPGGGNPANYTWTAVPNITLPIYNGSDYIEQTFEDVDVSGITGENYIAFKYYSNGSPTLWIIDDFKIMASGDDLSTGDDLKQSIFNVYPNPSNGNFNITLKEISKANVQVFSIRGSLIKDFETKENNFQITNLRSGIYILKISSDNKTETKKIIVQ